VETLRSPRRGGLASLVGARVSSASSPTEHLLALCDEPALSQMGLVSEEVLGSIPWSQLLPPQVTQVLVKAVGEAQAQWSMKGVLQGLADAIEEWL
jgi:hypothetical protein